MTRLSVCGLGVSCNEMSDTPMLLVVQLGSFNSHVIFKCFLSESPVSTRLASMWQQSGTLLFCSCHGISGFLVDELQI